MKTIKINGYRLGVSEVIPTKIGRARCVKLVGVHDEFPPRDRGDGVARYFTLIRDDRSPVIIEQDDAAWSAVLRELSMRTSNTSDEVLVDAVFTELVIATPIPNQIASGSDLDWIAAGVSVARMAGAVHRASETPVSDVDEHHRLVVTVCEAIDALAPALLIRRPMPVALTSLTNAIEDAVTELELEPTGSVAGDVELLGATVRQLRGVLGAAQTDLASAREMAAELDAVIVAEYRAHEARYTRPDGSNMSAPEIVATLAAASGGFPVITFRVHTGYEGFDAETSGLPSLAEAKAVAAKRYRREAQHVDFIDEDEPAAEVKFVPLEDELGSGDVYLGFTLTDQHKPLGTIAEEHRCARCRSVIVVSTVKYDRERDEEER